MQINFNGKFFRRLIGIIILLALVIVVGPALFKVQSANAIVNAHVVYVNSPLEGVVTEVFKSVGSTVERGDSLIVVNNPRISERLLEELKALRQTVMERINGLTRQQTSLQSMQSDLQVRIELHNSHETTRLEHQIAEARAQALAQQGTVNELKLTLEKNRKLLAQKFISELEFDRSRFGLEVGEAQLQAIEAKIRTLESEQTALAAGVYLGQGRNDVPYTQQKFEDITVQLINIQAEISEANARLMALEDQIAAERSNLQKLREATLAAPVSGMLWRLYFPVGSDVVLGSRLSALVDCNDLFVEAAVPDSNLAGLSEGSKVNYRLVGSSEWAVAEVFKIVGSGNKVRDETLAAELDTDSRDGRVFVRIAKDTLPDIQANQCYVGRAAEVTFDRTFNPKVLLTRLTGLFQ
ncbi:HlyD family secretion protein [Orrella daihaiensis]|uniref:HlyD family efflux transporter periplasmic adaptor subunit n=1 Tax=Orrella daihaiensis TaxID=2782176 RepID=A0ABY4AJ23_9BURK|nr:HlyD family efflux transporter periplasmic adaptor subunit [Orrella daihaiensis]UOD50277.1 HlyD family efflux transporter periplasmic adaptor subunit [Orrella daihaiensis]